MASSFAEVEAALNQLLSEVGNQMAAQDQEDMRQYIDVAEYGLAFEIFCASLSNAKLPVGQDVKAKVQALAGMMRMENNRFVHALLSLEESV